MSVCVVCLGQFLPADKVAPGSMCGDCQRRDDRLTEHVRRQFPPMRTSITWSSYSTAQVCRRAFWYRYCEGIELADASADSSDALLIGDAVHKLCGGAINVPDLPEHLGPIVAAMAAAWIVRWGEATVTPDRQIEAWIHEEIEASGVLVTIGAHCDEIRTIANGPGVQQIVVERKTASHVDGQYLERLALDQQIALQAYLAEVDTVLYDIIARAPIKRGKGETEEEFGERLRAAKKKNKSGNSSIARKHEEPLYNYQTRLATWYREHPQALMRCSITVDHDRKVAAVTQIAGLAASLRLAQRDVLAAATNDASSMVLDQHFGQSTQRCFDWGRRCEYWAACASGNNSNVKEQLYKIRTKREGDPPTNEETKQ